MQVTMEQEVEIGLVKLKKEKTMVGKFLVGAEQITAELRLDQSGYLVIQKLSNIGCLQLQQVQ